MTVDRGPQCILGRVAPPRRRFAGAPSAVNSYKERVQKALFCFERQQQRFIVALQPRSLLEQALDPTGGVDNARITGRQRLAKLRKAMASLGLTYSDDQREFTNRMIAACAKLIFKDDLEANLADLLIELSIKELQQELMAIMPRRYGKTMIVSAFTVAALLSIEGIEIGIFSTGRRASQKILENIYWLLCKHGDVTIDKHNVETIWIKGPYGKSDVRKVSSYPSNVRISLLGKNQLCCA